MKLTLIIAGLGIALFASVAVVHGPGVAALAVGGCLIAASGVCVPIMLYMIYMDRTK